MRRETAASMDPVVRARVEAGRRVELERARTRAALRAVPPPAFIVRAQPQPATDDEAPLPVVAMLPVPIATFVFDTTRRR